MLEGVLHNHPNLERKLELNTDKHVIVDVEDWLWVIGIIRSIKERQNEPHGKEKP